MKILGVDPGIGRIGWGVIAEEKGKLAPVAFNCVFTEPNKEIGKRLEDIYRAILMVIETYSPDVMTVEELFFNTNAKTALSVGQARGIILLCAAQKNLPVAVYTPLQVKLAVTGYGRADKQQIGQMVKMVLHLATNPKPDDTSDALAIAITHAFSRKMNGTRGMV